MQVQDNFTCFQLEEEGKKIDRARTLIFISTEFVSSRTTAAEEK
jgi:hypothetical protein